MFLIGSVILLISGDLLMIRIKRKIDINIVTYDASINSQNQLSVVMGKQEKISTHQEIDYDLTNSQVLANHRMVK